MVVEEYYLLNFSYLVLFLILTIYLGTYYDHRTQYRYYQKPVAIR